MKASVPALIVVLTSTSIVLVTNSASACGHGRCYGGGFYGGYRSYDQPAVYVKKVYVQPVEFAPTVVPPAPIAATASAPFGLPPAGGNPQANFLPQSALPAGPIDPRANMFPPGAGFAQPSNAFPQMNGAFPQGANFSPQNPAMNPQSYNGAPAGVPNNDPNAFQGFAPQANAFPQMNGATPQGGNFLPQGPTMNPQMFNGAPAGVPNGVPTAFQGNGPVTPNMAQPNVEGPTPTVPSANIRVVAAEEQLPSVAIGSIVVLDGPSLGSERGTVKLTIDGLSLPVEILEWNANTIKIQLPQLDVTSARKAEIEVLRAHGSLASKTAVELTPATSRLTLGN